MENSKTVEEAAENSRADNKWSKKMRRPPTSYFRCFFDVDFLIFKGFSFFIYGAYGGLTPFLPLYFKQLALGASYVGLIVGIRPLIQCIGAPFWGVLADRYRAGKIIFIGSLFAWIAKALVILSVRPHNQHCITIYTNTSANKSYVHVYDLWSPRTGEDDIQWVALPLGHLEIEKNKEVAVVNERIKGKLTADSLTGNVLKKSSRNNRRTKHNPLKNTGISKTRGSSDSKRYTSSVTKDRRSDYLSKDTFKYETNVLYAGLKLPSNNRESREMSPGKREEALSERLGLEITKIVEVYDEKLRGWMAFLTSIDKNEVDFMFVIFLLIIIIGEFLESPTYALSDASLLKRLGEEKEYYGNMRLWGSVGWAAASAIVGVIISVSTFKLCEVSQNNYVIAFYLFLGFVAGAFVNALWFRFTYDDKKHLEDIGKIGPLLLGLRHSSFLVATLYTGFCFGIVVHFINWVIEDLGGTSAIMGAAFAAREIAAVAMFGLSATAIQAMGAVNTMVLCLMSYIIYFICYSIIDEPWMAVALQVLDGATYGLLWSNCVNYMSIVGCQLGLIETTQGKCSTIGVILTCVNTAIHTSHFSFSIENFQEFPSKGTNCKTVGNIRRSNK